ncbi:Putative RAMP superfamily DNA repair protein [Ignavibacterium album JCM 16511]|uniref:CRISPR system Cms protein Csm4 n=1 Tax=Ignavibacterium album (strain DSM 19864 / JCM 16511 / NBRC 101810 / Mat9-16) TaxID=945713 RepID=I0AIV0_IGNAJ|nr:type III-A CRISPR-associated RAMP protein Csm4 [Ignavibacterium album]AFH48907.1 Putative RAMP superfamily DNA repair protein [Ignavibacterium album JCM 16511]
MKAYKLKFQSSFHIDEGSAVDGPSETFIHSDTLFSALVSAARKFYGKEVAEKFLSPRAVVLSSAFPYYKEEFFLPKPLYFFPENLKEYEMIKVFKEAKFISKDLLFKILSGTQVEEKYYSKEHILNGCWRINKNIKSLEEEDKIFEVQEVPHIVMDRISNQTQIFYKTEVYFNKNAGLYFIADINEELLKQFETVLRFLGDEGIGADRTIGKGLFEVEEIKNFSLSTSNESGFYYLLSLYSPTKEEFEKIDPKKSFYDFKIRGGWISNNTLNRKNVRMFVEGSVLKFLSNNKPIGSIHKVLNANEYPDDLMYDIYRSGQSLFLPVTGGVNDN